MAETSAESGCYVYRPNRDAIQATNDASNGNGGAKTTDRTKRSIDAERLQAFRHAWEPTKATLDRVLASADSGSVDQICAWLSQLRPRTLDRIATGLVTTSTSSSLLGKVRAHVDADTLVLSVPAAACTSLKSVLKCVVSAATASSLADAAAAAAAVAEDDLSTRHQAHRLLNYDLEALRQIVDARGYEKVLLYFGNGESLHGGVLSDAVDVLHSWHDRIPLVLLFETAVSVGLFQEKLTRRALRQLRGEAFATASAGDVVDAIFRAAAATDDLRQQQQQQQQQQRSRLWMGANPAEMLVERQAEHLQSAQAFVMAIKYMYMFHFYRTPLSVLLDRAEVTWTEAMTEAAVSLKSFKAYMEGLKKQKKSKEATRLMKDGNTLAELVLASIDEGQRRLTEISTIVQLLNSVHEIVPSKTALSWSKLYIQAMSGQLLESPTLRNLLLSVRAMTSESMERLLSRMSDFKVPNAESLISQLSELTKTYTDTGPLRSEHDQSLETTRTTVVAKKISLSRQKATLTEGDAEYTKLVKEVSTTLQDYIEQRLINPKSLLFNEIFLFDLRVPLREAFAPRPRHALEHALTVPGAYLACECCEPDERSLSSTQPATSVLYQLYLESGTIVNIADLWAAFDAVMPNQEHEESSMNEDVAVGDQKLALFYQSLAELKYLGMVKSSRKKADHLVKMRFLGL